MFIECLLTRIKNYTSVCVCLLGLGCCIVHAHFFVHTKVWLHSNSVSVVSILAMHWSSIFIHIREARIIITFIMHVYIIRFCAAFIHRRGIFTSFIISMLVWIKQS